MDIVGMLMESFLANVLLKMTKIRVNVKPIVHHLNPALVIKLILTMATVLYIHQLIKVVLLAINLTKKKIWLLPWPI